MKVLRSTVVAAVAFVAVACGDKVTVAGPPVADTTPTVNSVSVAPATATLNIGQTVTFSASVNASNGAATTVTWQSSDPSKVSMSGAVATANAATPGVAICATSTVDSGKQGCASVAVTAAATVIPASLSIQSITATGNTATTVNPAAVAGAIDVRLNVAPGNQTVSKIVLVVGGVRADSQIYTAAQAASLRYAADLAAETQSTFPQVLLGVNTANFNATTGAPTWLNGPQLVSAQLYTTGGTSAAATASAQTSLTFANTNAFSTTVTTGGTTAATANNATGFKFDRGDIVVSAIPVSYTGVALSTASINFGAQACDGLGLTAQRTIALTAPTAPAVAWTATLANSGTAGAGNLKNYSFNPAGVGCAFTLTTGENVTVVAAQGANGNPFTTTPLPITVGSAFRMDNLAPTVPAITMTIVSVRNTANWVNDGVKFNDVAVNGGIISTASTEVVGAGGIGLATANSGIYSTTVGGNVITTAASLAESPVNSTYSATATAKDLLGNTSAASGAATFGVDRTAPTIAALAAPATNTSLLAVTPGATIFGAITYSDAATLPAGPSTPSGTPVRVTITRRTTATASTKWNSAAVPTAFNATGGEFSAGLAGPALDPGATNVQGYYVVTAYVEDGAANPSLSVTRDYLYDTTAPTGPFSIPVMTTSAGSANLFTATAADNLDLASTSWGHNYAVMDAAPGAAGSQILEPATAIGAFETFTTSATSATTMPLLRSMMNTAAGVPVFPGGSLISMTHTVVDRSGVAGGTVSVTNAVPGANLPTLPVANPYATSTAFTGVGGFSVTNAATTVDISGNATAPQVNSVNLTATAVGTVNVALNPFSRVEFYVYDGVSNTYRLLGTATTPTVVDNVTNRVYTWTANWDPNAVGQYNNPVAAGVQNVVAVGVNATHDGVRTAANANITTVP